MKEKQENLQGREPDRHLDVPSEANRDKHINFREVNEEDNELISFENKDEVKERRKEWKQGIEEGRQKRRKDAD